MIFHDRKEAGTKLAKALEKYKGEETVVFALPRGGVPLGYEIAKNLGARLDLIITKKIGHPHNDEYAIGAIAENGTPVYNSWEIDRIDSKWLEEEQIKIRGEIKRRREKYLEGKKPIPVEGKTVIIVDDGIATGLTMMAAISEMKKQRPKRLVVAIPVTPDDTAKTLRLMVDDLVSLYIDADYLGSVGSYYEEFNQVDDDEVISLLKLNESLYRE